MRIKKKPALILLMIVSMLCLIFGAVACGGTSAKDAIEKYILPQNETLVDADFTLPKTIGTGIEVKWQSSNTDVIAIEDSGDKYTAKVTLPTEVTTVTLTISSGEHSKNFTVRVDEFSVFTFIKNYKFAQKNTAVKEDFKLETKTTYQGKEATIEWSIDEKYNAWINLNAAKDTVLVTPAEEVKPVEIAAKFTYAGESATQKYSFSVTPILDHRQIVKNMYSQEDYALELSGYIVHVYQALIHEKYGPEATFYMIDDDFCSGYYLYNVEIQEDQVDKYVAGAHVTVTGATGTSYNGLWENKSNSGLAVIDDKDPIDPREKVYALDTDLLADAPSMLWRESTFVSLTGWKVLHKGNYNSTSKTYEKPTGADQNLFTLEKNGTEIVVRISKYMNRTDDELAALVAVYDDVNEGEFINVTGILGNYKGFQIQPIVASDITKATAESTSTDGAKVKAAIKAVNDAVAANFSSLIAAHKEVTMPTSAEGVTISYKVAGATNPTVTINGGTFTIDPVDSEKNYDIEVTYKIGDYAAYDFFKLHNWKQSSEQIVDNVKAELEKAKIDDIKRVGEFDLPEVDALGATITWTVKAPAPAWIAIEGGKIKVTALPAQDTEVTLVATIALDGQTATAELTLKVAAASAVAFKAIDAPAAGDYIFALYQGTLDKWLYSTGEINSNNFGVTTENPAEAATFTLAASGEGWTIQLKSTGKFLELNDNHRMTFVDASTQAWKWNAEYKVFTFDVTESGSPVTYYIGSYNDFDTFSASKTSYLSSGTNFVAQLGTMVAAELTFKAIEAPAAGEFIFSAAKNDTRLYASSLELDGGNEGYIQTSEDVADAVKFTLEKHGENGWYIKMGAKYLEINPYASSDGKKTSYKLKLVDTPSKDWTWFAAAKCFQQEATEVHTTENPATGNFYIGTYNTSKYNTLSPSNVTYITGDNAKNLDVSQHPGRFGEMVAGQPGTTEPEPEPEPELPGGGTLEDPYTVAEAIEIINELADKGYYGDPVKEVYVKGVVVKASSLNSFTIGATKDATETVTVYGATLNTEGTFTKAGDLVAGAEITVSGALYKYGTTSEIASTGNIKVKVVSYTDPRTDAEKATAAKDAVLMPKRVDENFELPAANVTGVTFEWAIAENSAAKLSSDSEAVEVTRGAADVEFTLTLTVKCGSETQTKTYTITVKGVLAAGEHTATLDFTSDFKTYYAADWTNSYTEHVIKMADVSDSGIKGTVTLSNASKQTSTITDRPTMAAKNSVTAYVTVYADGAPLTSVTFTLKQWTAKKKFSKIFIETSTDGSEWTAYGTPVGDGASNTVVITDSGNEANNVFTFTATDETVKYVRLSIQATGKDNVQVGLTSVALTVKIPAAAAATSVAPVALLPGKEF